MAGYDYHPRSSKALAAIANLHSKCNSVKRHRPSAVGIGTLEDNLPVGGGNWSRAEVLRYGDFAMATYEAFDGDKGSRYYGTCRYGLRRMLPALGLAVHGYQVTAFIYATADLLPEWVEPVLQAERWDDRAYWIGYVAVASDEEARLAGFRDVAVVWRGTTAWVEWALDIRTGLVNFDVDGNKKKGEKVATGFYGLYTSKNTENEHGYGRKSAREEVAGELRRLVTHFRDERGEKVRVTVTGHSLGGALSLLAARDAAAAHPDVPVRAITFAAPRVGNAAFRDGLVSRSGVSVLRVVVRNDVVPLLPLVPVANLLALPFHLLLGKALTFLTRGWAPSWVYVHAGDELALDAGDVLALDLDVTKCPFLKHAHDLVRFHSLETYLRLLAGRESAAGEFRVMHDGRAHLELALVNKTSNSMLRDKLSMLMGKREEDDLPVQDDRLPLSELD